MGLMDALRKRNSSQTMERQEEPRVACDHRSLLPRWDRLEDMGREDLASSFQCDACGQVFSVEEAGQLREEAVRRLHETI